MAQGRVTGALMLDRANYSLVTPHTGKGILCQGRGEKANEPLGENSSTRAVLISKMNSYNRSPSDLDVC